MPYPRQWNTAQYWIIINFTIGCRWNNHFLFCLTQFRRIDEKRTDLTLTNESDENSCYQDESIIFFSQDQRDKLKLLIELKQNWTLELVPLSHAKVQKTIKKNSWSQLWYILWIQEENLFVQCNILLSKTCNEICCQKKDTLQHESFCQILRIHTYQGYRDM